MGSFITLDINSITSILKTCHNCPTGNLAEVNFGESLAARIRSDLHSNIIFICCGLNIYPEGAIFWHSEEVSAAPQGHIVAGIRYSHSQTDSAVYNGTVAKQMSRAVLILSRDHPSIATPSIVSQSRPCSRPKTSVHTCESHSVVVSSCASGSFFKKKIPHVGNSLIFYHGLSVLSQLIPIGNEGSEFEASYMGDVPEFLDDDSLHLN
ncbi:unnamed protein product, partial [Meganyctiphanes norvegica]